LNQRNANAVKAHFDRAVTAARSGDVATAERICRRALEQHPRDPNLQSLLGSLLVQTGRSDEGLTRLRRATELAPASTTMHQKLGEALLAAGSIDEGLRSLETARRIDPSKISLLTTMGDVLTRLGRDEDALRLYRDLVSRRPDEIGALQRLGGAAFRLRRFAECEAAITRVVALAPGLYEGRMDLGHVQQQLDKLGEAEASFREAARIDPGLAEPHAALGHVLASAGKLDDAATAFRRALEIDGGHASALLGLGEVLRAQGDEPGAISAYRLCIARQPDSGVAYWSLASLHSHSFTDAEIAAMRAQLRNPALPPMQRPGIAFALATTLERRGEFAAAFELYTDANAAFRRFVVYDANATRARHDALIDVFTRELLSDRAGHGDPDDAPIFVVGHPHSSTNVVARMLARHGSVGGVFDTPVLERLARSTGAEGSQYPQSVVSLNNDRLRDLAGRYLEATRSARTGAARFVDAATSGFEQVGLISLLLPNARIVHVRRDPIEVCVAAWRQFAVRGQPWSFDLDEIGQHYLAYERLMAHWQDVLPGRVLEVRHEDLLQDPAGQTRRLLEHCGLSWDEGCLPEPADMRSPPDWRNYEAQLGPLTELLGRRTAARARLPE
jgi:tetratricopeptide (TPR) repeat protein